MASPTVVKIQMRRDNEANWNNSTVPLLEGEPGFDTTNNILKIGPAGGSTWSAITQTFITTPTRYTISNFNNSSFRVLNNTSVYQVIGSDITIPKNGTWHFGLKFIAGIVTFSTGSNATLNIGWLYKPGGTGNYQLYSTASSIIINSFVNGDQFFNTPEVFASGLSPGDKFAFGYKLYTEDPAAAINIVTQDGEGWLMYPNQPTQAWSFP
jgi:hypothetical protein